MSSTIADQTINVFNPATRESLADIPITSTDELDGLLTHARQSAATWNASSVRHRVAILKRFRKAIVLASEDLIQTICNETGKKHFEGLLEVITSLEHLKRAAISAPRILKPRSRNSGFLKYKRSHIQYEPLGVAGIISPWNYPLILSLSPVVEALLAGNTVVLKPSEQTPLTAKLLKKIWDSIDVNSDIFQVINGAGETGSHLVDSPNTDIICFTGSTQIGRKIAEACARQLKPVILELGGKDPMVVLNDAPLERALQAAIWGGMSNAGQTCISVERIYVQKDLYSEFSHRISDMVSNVSAGPGESDTIGPITIANGYEKIINQLNDLPESIRIEKGKASTEDLFIAPTVVFDPPKDSAVICEETFGPVITITPFNTIEDAIQLANDTGYGLSASVFTRNKTHAKYLAEKINAGSVVINDVLTGYGIADLPFGGRGLSGFGRVHGEEGLKAFSHVKSITDNRFMFKSEPWWYVNQKRVQNLLKKFIRWYYG
ncbi:MAG: aldehyde dehydrogenase family protein [Candidatus Marinimicrobia bacterium]|nr:aldehyde dehydrogenase family protein [Candidatus Neomarinimicrobiota bacterium]